jgi:hypothetical protein
MNKNRMIKYMQTSAHSLNERPPIRLQYQQPATIVSPLLAKIPKIISIQNFLQEKEVETTSKKKKIGKKLSPRNRKACHNISCALLKSVAEIGTQSAMKSSRKKGR